MIPSEEIERWRGVVSRLVRGPAPRGREFDLCREILAATPPVPQRLPAARMLLEGAMADAATGIGDAQQVMTLLKACDRGDLDLEALLDGR